MGPSFYRTVLILFYNDMAILTVIRRRLWDSLLCSSGNEPRLHNTTRLMTWTKAKNPTDRNSSTDFQLFGPITD